jgi:hypothetical protein
LLLIKLSNSSNDKIRKSPTIFVKTTFLYLSHFLYLKKRRFSLLIEDNKCYGVSVLQNNKKMNIYANAVVIASGGVGMV